jgi:hypothetical protein
MISEIDGNCITSCKNGDYIYIFHSHTECYETGIFIFDMRTNMFNNDDFYLSSKQFDVETDSGNDDIHVNNNFQSNKFSMFHEKDIEDCYVHNGKIFLIIYNNIDDAKTINDIYLYDLHELSLITQMENIREIRVKDGVIYGREDNIIKYIDSDGMIQTLEICPRNHLPSFWDVYNDKLIVISFLYQNPYGQIYSSTRSYKELKIMQYTI